MTAPFSRLAHLVRNLLRRRRVDADLDAELRAHVELLAAQHVADGMDDAAARRTAAIELGGADQVKEAVRDVRMGARLESLGQDVRYGLRALGRTPTFTVTAILTLALGIGANSAIFSAAHAVLFEPLPYPHADRLVAITSSPQGESPVANGVAYQAFVDWDERHRSIASLAAYAVSGATLTGRGDPAVLDTVVATPGLFETLEANAALGRALLPADGVAGAENVVVISDRLWRDRFNGDPAIVGEHLTLDSAVYTVVGVMPSGFRFPHVEPAPQVWMPVTQNQPFHPLLAVRAAPFLSVIGRLSPGHGVADAQAEMAAIGSALARSYPASDAGRAIVVTPLKQEIVGDVRPALLMLLAAVALLLLIACANVASLYLARTASRTRELAIRTALGASRGRLFRQLIVESLLLALGAGAVGLLVAYAGIRAVQAVLLQDLPPIRTIGIDGVVLGFTLLLSCLTGVMFGGVPAVASMRLDPQEHLKAGGRGATHDPKRARIQRMLVAGEIALALTMLTGAGLLIRSLTRLKHVDPGFNTARLLTATINLPRTTYQTPAQWKAFNAELRRRVNALPNVERAAFAVSVPFAGPPVSVPFTMPGRPFRQGERTAANIVEAGTDFFQVMRISITKGRAFEDTDTDSSLPVAIVNTAFARRFFGTADPIGRQIQIGRHPGTSQIVGVVADTTQSSLAAPPAPTLYVPYSQMPFFVTTFVLRTETAPDTVIAAVRRQVAAIDPTVPVFAAEPMATLVERSWSGSGHRTLLLALLSGVALVLMVVGIYAILAYTVAQRRREMGVRIALGAEPRQVSRMVLVQGLRLTAAGIAAGAALSQGLTPLLAALLFHVSARDPATLIGVPALLAIVCLTACYIPARRASRVDPVIALQDE